MIVPGPPSRSGRGAWLCALALALALGAGPAVGQADPGTVAGLLVDSTTGQPISGALVYANGVAGAITDPSGAFRLGNLARGTSLLEIRRIGYAPLSLEVWVDADTLALRVSMFPVAIRLAEIVIEGELAVSGALRGFEERRREGFGRFMTREDIERRAATRVSDLLRTVPGLIVSRDPFTGRTTIGSRRVVALGAGCPANLFVDGMRVEPTDVDYLIPDQVWGIEVYRGPSEAPIRFMGSSNCGATVVIWTR